MKIKVSDDGSIRVTCEGKSKKAVLRDLSDAFAFVENNLDVTAPKPKKKVVRKPRKKAMLPPKAPVVPDQTAQKSPPPKKGEGPLEAVKDANKIKVK